MPVPTPLEYGELLDGADLAQDGNGEEMELVLEILHCWPPTCRVSGDGQSILPGKR